jgi:acrosin
VDQFTVNNPNGPLVLDTEAGNDVVNVQALSKPATINGGAGNDTFHVSSDAPINLGTLNGINGRLTINAGNRSNVLGVSDYGQTSLTDNVTVTPSAISGYAGSSKGTVINYTGTFSSVILSGSNTNANTFTVSGSTVAVLQGGNGNDTFNLGKRATAKSIDGGAGTDTLSYAAYTSPVSVALTGSDGTGFSSTAATGLTTFQGIDNLVGGQGSASLTGEDVSSIWNVSASSGSSSYLDDSHTLTFSGFTTLNAGGAGDTFALQAGASNYALNGGPGADTLTGVSDAVLSSSNSDGFSGLADSAISFSAIDVLEGAGTPAGEDMASTWTLGRANSYSDGTATLAFSGFESVNAGPAGDTFNINGATDVTAANGGAGNDTFNVYASASLNLSGKAGSDTFNLSDGVTLTGTINGGSGSNTLSYAAYTSPVSVDLSGSSAMTGFSSSSATGLSSFSGIDVLVGG